MIDILLVDDRTLLCEVLKSWLDVEKDIQVVGIAHDGREAIEQVERLQPDIVLMDIDMPQMDGLKATKVISQCFPQVKVIVLSGHEDNVYLSKSLRAGAKEYLLKNTTAAELVRTIHSVYNNINLFDPERHISSGADLQNQLEELIKTYRFKFENIVKEYESNAIATEQLKLIEQKLSELENKISTEQIKNIRELEIRNQSSWKLIRQELLAVNSQLEGANSNLSNQFEQQIKNLKQDLYGKLFSALDNWTRQRAALQEWAVQRDRMRPSIEDYQTKSRQELISLINPIQDSFKDVDKQLRTMRNWLIASGLLSLLALTASGYLLIDRLASPNSSSVPKQDLIE